MPGPRAGHAAVAIGGRIELCDISASHALFSSGLAGSSKRARKKLPCT